MATKVFETMIDLTIPVVRKIIIDAGESKYIPEEYQCHRFNRDWLLNVSRLVDKAVTASGFKLLKIVISKVHFAHLSLRF